MSTTSSFRLDTTTQSDSFASTMFGASVAIGLCASGMPAFKLEPYPIAFAALVTECVT